MYIPASHAETDLPTIHEFMRQNSFATLVSRNEGGLVASHLPILLDVDTVPNGVLSGHMARANPQWRDIAGEVLVIFHGPHVYVSPTWYESAGTVPTWNYVAVHAYGTLELVEGRDAVVEILNRSVAFFESARTNPWPFEPTASHVNAMVQSIVGFRIEISRLEGKWKLSQNHPEERRRRVIGALDELSDDNSRQIATLMKEGLSRS